MDTELGKKLSTVVHVQNLYGATESGWAGLQIQTDLEDWDYIHMAEAPGLEFRESTPGVYEFVIVRQPAEKDFQAIWYSFPEKQEYRTNDLFRKHPTKPNYWFYEGRTDDLIVYRNISKFNPLGFEEHLRTHPLIRYAIVIGSKRLQSSLLIELEEDAKTTSQADILAEIWPTIEAANAVAPKHAVVERTHIIFEKPEKPFLRTSKGTVQKIPTQKLYQPELDEMYATFGDQKIGAALAPMVPAAEETVSETTAPPQSPTKSLAETHVNGTAAVDGGVGIMELKLKQIELEKRMVELELQEVALRIKLKESQLGTGGQVPIAVQ
jgi:hypothetical protein